MIERLNFSELVGAFTRKSRAAQDHLRLRNVVEVVVRDKAGNVKSRSKTTNMRVNGGADFWDTQLFTTSPGGAGATFIGLTTDATAPGATDTTLTSEETTNGLARASASHSHTAASSTTTFTKTFTYTGSSSKVIAKVGLFNASSAGTLVLETLLSSTATVNANGDTISITWTINF